MNKIIPNTYVHHIALRASNFNRSLEFYKALGMKVRANWVGASGNIALLDIGNGTCIELFGGGDEYIPEGHFFHLAIEEVDIAQSIIDAGKWIRHVHLGDSNRLAPGYGHTDWKAGLGALSKIGFNGYMNLECGVPGPYDVVLPEVAEYLRKIAASM